MRMLRVISAVICIAAALAFAPAPALADGISVGAAFGSFQPYVDSAVGALITALIGWALYFAQQKLSISVSDSNRSALETFLKNQAASLVASGAVKLNGVQIQVGNAALAAAANMAIQHIPDALAYFGLTPASIAPKIVDALPHVPSVAQAQAIAIDVANPGTPSTAPATAPKA